MIVQFKKLLNLIVQRMFNARITNPVPTLSQGGARGLNKALPEQILLEITLPTIRLYAVLTTPLVLDWKHSLHTNMSNYLLFYLQIIIFFFVLTNRIV